MPIPPTSLLGWSLHHRDPATIQAWMPLWGWFYEHYFRVQTSGWETIPTDQPVLFVGSHNGGLASPDTVMVLYDWFRRFGVDRPAYGLLHPNIWKVPPLADLAAKTGALMAHPKPAIAALRSGASVLVYPGGPQDVFRPHSQRHRIHLCDRTGFIKLALQTEVPIVPVISIGAHDTLMVLGDIYPQIRQWHEWGMPWLFGLDPHVFPIYLGLPWGLAVGPVPNWPLPIPMHTQICPSIAFPRYGAEAARDRAYVQECYAIVASKMQFALDALVAQVYPSSVGSPLSR